MPQDTSSKSQDSQHLKSSTTAQKSTSDSETHPDQNSSPLFTPSGTESGTPLRDNHSSSHASLDLENMADEAEMDGAKTDGQETKTEIQPPQGDGSPSTKTEVKATNASEVAPKKAVCKKHPDGPNKSRKKGKSKKDAKDAASSDSDSSSDSSSDSDDEESSESESESSESEEKKKKQKKKAKAKAKKLKEKKKAKKQREDSSDDSSDSDEDSSEDEKAKKKAAKAKAKKKAKKQRREEESEQEVEEDPNQLALRQAQQLAQLQLNQRAVTRRRAGRAGFPPFGAGRNIQIDNGLGALAGNKKVAGKKKKRASKVAFKRVDQLWDNTIHNYKLTETVDDPDADEWDQYIFTVRRKFDWENKYTETVVDIKSKPLKDALLHVMEGVKGVSLVQDTPVLDPNMLFLYLEEARAYQKELKALGKSEKKKKAKKSAETKAAHLKILLKYLDKDYAETKKTLYPLLESNTITFDLLWALFKPNTIAYCPTYSNPDEPRAFKIEYATKESHFMKGQWYNVEGRYLEYDGKSFGMGTMACDVEAFKGPRKITSLGCYPLKYHKNQEEVKAKLIERGKKFVALKGMNYRFHKGMAFYKKKRAVIKVNINGRIMVDPAIHRRINPNYPISTVKPKDPDMFENSDDEDDDDSCCCGNQSSEDDIPQAHTGLEDVGEKVKLRVVVDPDGRAQVVEVAVDENGHEVQKENIDKIEGDTEESTKQPEFTDEELLIASPVVLGFAFSEKLWLEFTVSGINDIEWNVGAFDSLVLPENQKSIVKALVESHTFHAAENIDDVIQGKGKGLVAVLHGPPGTGKTLTAEGIAELLKCPLYMVSAGELGTDPRTLEAELNKILDIAHSWGAVLLLDEADVFLEKRTIQDIHRNALVSIFLRLLEYFQGILFLTTNRVETFDDAFQSRIHVALRYGELTTKAKRAVWKLFLERVKAKDGVEIVKFKESDFDALARHNLNGRQIKNSVRTAQALAVNEKQPLSMAHITRVLEVAETFDHDLKGGTGYMDAMRSYT